MTRRSRGLSVGLAVKLFGSTLAAQAAALIATTLAALRTSPAEFAIYGAVVALTAVVSSVNSLAAETRIIVVDADDSDALTRAGFTALITSGLVIGFLGILCAVMHLPSAEALLFVAPGCMAVSMVGLLSAIVIREQKQSLLARNRVVQGLSNAALVGIGIFTPLSGHLVLIGAWILSTVLGGGLMAVGVAPFLGAFRMARRDDWKVLVRQVSLQPVNNLVASLGTSLPLMLLPTVGATNLAGAWTLTSRILNAVVNTVFSTASPIYNGDLGALIRGREFTRLRGFHAGWLRRLLALTPFMVGGILIGIYGLMPNLGREWAATRDVAIPACLSFTALLVWLPISQTLTMLGRIHREFVWSVCNLTVSAVSLGSALWLGAEAALTIWASAQVVSLAIHTLLQRSALGSLAGA